MKTQCDVIVVGGGASGLLCAVMLAKKGVQVTVLEKNHRIGKKLSATGNGRCNFTNLHMNENCYYGNSEFISHLLTEVSAKWLCLSAYESGCDCCEWAVSCLHTVWSDNL